MEISVNNDSKIVTIWLSHSDEVGLQVKDLVAQTIGEYKKRKYKVAVLRSGSQDRFKNTESIVLANL